MEIPVENVLAFFPPKVKAGNITLGPLTLSGVVRLGERGIDLAQRIPTDRLFEVAHVLAENRTGRALTPGDYKRFLRHVRVGLNELANAVNKVLNDAFATYVKTISDKKTKSICKEGLGMPLEYAEFLCAEYGWSFETAINTPLATVYALYAAYWRRNGGKLGIDYMNKTAKPIKL